MFVDDDSTKVMLRWNFNDSTVLGENIKHLYLIDSFNLECGFKKLWKTWTFETHLLCLCRYFTTIAGSPSQVQVLWIGRSSQPIRAQYYTDWPITGQIKGSPPFLNHLFSWMISNISIDAHSAAIKGFGTQLCTSTYHPTQ